MQRGSGTVPPTGVSTIGDGISGASEIWGTVQIPHLQGEVKADEVLGIRKMWGHYKGGAVGVLWEDPYAHVHIGEVYRGKEYQDEGRVILKNVSKEAQ